MTDLPQHMAQTSNPDPQPGEHWVIRTATGFLSGIVLGKGYRARKTNSHSRDAFESNERARGYLLQRTHTLHDLSDWYFVAQKGEFVERWGPFVERLQEQSAQWQDKWTEALDTASEFLEFLGLSLGDTSKRHQFRPHVTAGLTVDSCDRNHRWKSWEQKDLFPDYFVLQFSSSDPKVNFMLAPLLQRYRQVDYQSDKGYFLNISHGQDTSYCIGLQIIQDLLEYDKINNCFQRLRSTWDLFSDPFNKVQQIKLKPEWTNPFK